MVFDRKTIPECPAEGSESLTVVVQSIVQQGWVCVCSKGKGEVLGQLSVLI